LPISSFERHQPLGERTKVWLKSAIAKTRHRNTNTITCCEVEVTRGIQSAQDPVLDHSQKTGETALPDWLKGWWSVNDGEQYY
jgi:hypothetical protein